MHSLFEQAESDPRSPNQGFRASPNRRSPKPKLARTSFLQTPRFHKLSIFLNKGKAISGGGRTIDTATPTHTARIGSAQSAAIQFCANAGLMRGEDPRFWAHHVVHVSPGLDVKRLVLRMTAVLDNLLQRLVSITARRYRQAHEDAEGAICGGKAACDYARSCAS